MKKYLPFLIILASYGCANQQSNIVKTQPTLQQANSDSAVINTNQLSSTKQTKSDKVTTKTFLNKTIEKKKKTSKQKTIKTTPVKINNSQSPTLSHIPPKSKNPKSKVIAMVQTPPQPIKPDITSFDLEKLPLKYGHTWVLDRKKDSISNTTRCMISSLTKTFYDGYSESSITIQLTANSLFIKTNSTIDMSYPDTGVVIDQNTSLPLEKLFGDSSILIKQNTKKIIMQLTQGKQLTIKLGFWPTWPKSETRRIDFSLTDFDKAYQSFIACEKL